MASRRIIWTAAAVAVAVVAVFWAVRDGAPGKDDPAAYTKHTVEQAIDRYQREGRQATLDHYRDPASVDGSWYVFIIDGDGYTIAHYNPDRLYMDPALRVDVTGHFYGDELLSATEEGKWVNYYFLNPETGEEQEKHSWVVLHDGLLFGSGWYEGSD